MCRYAFHTYKPHFACFDCRKMFRPTANEDLVVAKPAGWGKPSRIHSTVPRRDFKCPQCGQQMHDMGLNFKAPKHNDLKQWRKVQLLHRYGGTWNDCGCGGYGPNAKTLSEAEMQVASWQHWRFPNAIKSLSELQQTRGQRKKLRKDRLKGISSTR